MIAIIPRSVVAVFVSVALLWPLAGASDAMAGAQGLPSELSDSLVPAPGLTPDEVVRIQLNALRRNDAANRGIAVAFRFASPANKASTGPLPRFIHMIKAGPYRMMLEFEHASYGSLEVEGDRAAQRVTLVGSEEVVSFVFLLARQSGPLCQGCWMTEGVVVVPEAGRAA
jgi:hypothetical protein